MVGIGYYGQDLNNGDFGLGRHRLLLNMAEIVQMKE